VQISRIRAVATHLDVSAGLLIAARWNVDRALEKTEDAVTFICGGTESQGRALKMETRQD